MDNRGFGLIETVIAVGLLAFLMSVTAEGVVLVRRVSGITHRSAMAVRMAAETLVSARQTALSPFPVNKKEDLFRDGTPYTVTTQLRPTADRTISLVKIIVEWDNPGGLRRNLTVNSISWQPS